MDDITGAISGLTDRVFTYRVARMLINKGIIAMPPLIQIKGLAASIAEAKKGISDVRSAVVDLNTESSGLKSDLGDITNQLKQHRSDLRFEAETLGNGGENSQSDDKTTKQDAEKPSGQPAAGSGSSPEVEVARVDTFPGK